MVPRQRVPGFRPSPGFAPAAPFEGRIAVVANRRPQVLALAAIGLAVARALSVAVPLTAFVTLAVWLAVAVAVRALGSRTGIAATVARFQTLWLCLDVALLATVLHLIGVSLGMTPALFDLVALATASLLLIVLLARQESLLQAMRRSEERYRLVVDSASHIIVTVAPSGELTTINDAALSDSGYTREDLVGRSFADFVAVEDVPSAGAFVARAFRGDEVKFTLRFLRKNGEVRWLDGTLSPIRTGNAVTAVLCICRDVTDERSATLRLRASDQRFRTMVDTAFEGIWTIDRHRRIDYVNRRLSEILGYTPEEMHGRDVFDVVPEWKVNDQPDDRRVRTPGVYELNLQRKDGTRTWVIISTSPLLDPSGGFEGALAMITDISQQKRVEKELRDSSDHLGAIIETQYEIASADLDVSRIMELIIQRTQTLTRADGAAILLVDGGQEMVYRAVSGVTSQLLEVRMPMAGSVSGECARTGEIMRCDDAETDPVVNRLLARRTNVRSVLAVPLLYDHQVVGVLEQAACAPNFFDERDVDTLRLMGGVLAAALGHAKEFEEKKRLIAARTAALSELQASQERFRTAFECSAVGMTLTASDGRFTQANRALSDMLGYAPEELTNISFIDITHPDDREVSLTAMKRLLRGEARDFQIEKRYLHKNGETVWVLLGVSVARDADGFPLHFVSQMVDITQRKRAEAERQKLQVQLSQSSKMQALGQLVSGVAHELNNPLAAILGFSEILLQDCRDEQTRESLNIIFGQAQRSRAIVRDLLSFVRHREGRARAPTDMREMLDRVARALVPAAASSGATFDADLPDSYPTLDVDRSGLEQVFTNLVMNAIQAVGDGGHVRMSARTVRDRLEIAVEDSGPGIAADVLPHIFEPFFTTKPVGEGTGLGLSVSLGIVEQHGGTLRAENRPHAEGGGARFVVSLPLTVVRSVPTDADGQPLGVRLSPRRTPLGMATVRESVRPVPPAAAAPGTVPPPAVAGSRSRVGLPITAPVGATALPAGPAASPAQPAPGAAGQTPPHVLVIDDEAPIRNALRRFFERRGWTVDEAVDGAHGLAAVMSSAQGPFDIMICDLKMPGVSGMELYSTLSAQRPELLGRLIFATGDVASPDAAAFLQRTRCPVLEKPYELSVLAETVERVRGSAPPLARTG